LSLLKTVESHIQRNLKYYVCPYKDTQRSSFYFLSAIFNLLSMSMTTDHDMCFQLPFLFYFTLQFPAPKPTEMRIKGFQDILRKASPWTIVCTVLAECFARYTLNTSFTDFEKKIDTLQPLQKTWLNTANRPVAIKSRVLSSNIPPLFLFSFYIWMNLFSYWI
jgi:hypothetical protein